MEIYKFFRGTTLIEYNHLLGRSQLCPWGQFGNWPSRSFCWM